MSWNESEYPRDDDGKFTDGNGGVKKTQWITSKRDYSNVIGIDKKSLQSDDETASFTETKQIEDLIKTKNWFIVKNIDGTEYNSNNEISLEGCDLQSARGVFKAHQTLFTRFPQLIGKLAGMRTIKLVSTTMAQCSMGFGCGGLQLNILWFGKNDRFQNVYAEGVARNYHPQGTETDAATAVTMHELGHEIDDYLSFISGKKGFLSHSLRPKIMKQCGYTIGDIEAQVCEYATTNADEWFAECWCEYMISSNPRPVAQALGDLVSKVIRGE